MSREDVEEAIIQPMLALYMPGQHIRGDQEAQIRALEEYASALEEFDRPTLERAWKHVRDNHELVIWPTVNQFKSAAKRFQPRPLPPSEHEQKQEQATELMNAKLREYRKTSTVYKQAQRDGWAGELMSFIQSEVSIQAQVLAGCEHIGFDSHLARLIHPGRRFDSAKEAYQAIREWLGPKFQEEGKIIIKPPPKKLTQQWKEEAEKKEAGPMASTLREVIEKQRDQSSAEVGG